ncbi:MAG TPA: hypothetical protein VJC16_06830 [Candidatus Nanoarchaeia archaeon]|nr:hypothetical protein [Candidatus Nanoarchaeia archaeon]
MSTKIAAQLRSLWGIKGGGGKAVLIAVGLIALVLASWTLNLALGIISLVLIIFWHALPYLIGGAIIAGVIYLMWRGLKGN